jgi:branched-chain amino acid transport system substrate-binding protein
VTRVYASLPLTGPQRAAGREILRGADLALERAPGVELVALDSFDAEDREQRAVEIAREAAGDPRALAYLGDFHSSQVWATSPVLGAAGLLQVAPVATFVELGGPTLVRLSPHDGIGARAIARRLAVRSRPIWDHDEPMELDGAEAFLYVGVAGSGAVGLWHDLHAANQAMWLLGSDGIAAPWLASELNAAEAERTRFFVAQRGPMAFYGFEAMALILDAIAAGDGDRTRTADAARSTRDRDSILGRYSIDPDGHTTSTAYGRLAVDDGELVWDR